MEHPQGKKDDLVILVIGPESSGTRWIASLLSQHPNVDIGCSGEHDDPLDSFWERKTDDIPDEVIVTRRSLPAGRNGKAAKYLEFEDLDRLPLERLKVVVVTRHPYATAKSMAKNRKSVKGQVSKAIDQMWAAYLHLFDYLVRNQVSFVVLPMESVILDGSAAIRSLFPILGLDPVDVTVKPKKVNAKWVSETAS